jgi:hypothetical protein
MMTWDEFKQLVDRLVSDGEGLCWIDWSGTAKSVKVKRDTHGRVQITDGDDVDEVQ